MFDVGFWELALIGVVALLIVGPERLPGVVRTAGRWAGQARRMVRDAKADLEREMKAHDLADLDDLKSDVQSAGREFQRAAQDIDAEVAAAKPGQFGDELRETLRGAGPATTAGGDSPGDGDSPAAATAPADGAGDGTGGDHYIYESRRGRAVLHAAHCTYCNHGRGRGGRGASKGAHWHGPYASRASAERAQRAMAATVKKVCACVERSATVGVASTVAAAAASTTAAPASTAAESTPPAAASTAAESTPPAAASPTTTTASPSTHP